MDELYNILPKDLVFIIEDYSKDRTNYDTVLKEFKAITDYCLLQVCNYDLIIQCAPNCFKFTEYALDQVVLNPYIGYKFRYEILTMNKEQRFSLKKTEVAI